MNLDLSNISTGSLEQLAELLRHLTSPHPLIESERVTLWHSIDGEMKRRRMGALHQNEFQS